MRGLTATDLFPIDAECERLAPLDVASVLLRHGGAPVSDHLPIGERDAMLLELRGLTLGQELTLCDCCPDCGLPLEIQLAIPALATAAPSPEAEAAATSLCVAGRPMRLRRAEPADLRAALRAGAAARGALAALCLEPLDGGPLVQPAEIDEDLLDDIAGRLAGLDPQADLLFAFACPDCGLEWTSVLDIVDYFWTELRGHVSALADDVDDLARAYHWSESDILALPARRRAAYLERVRA
jgi:hypothetical protein